MGLLSIRPYEEDILKVVPHALRMGLACVRQLSDDCTLLMDVAYRAEPAILGSLGLLLMGSTIVPIQIFIP